MANSISDQDRTACELLNAYRKGDDGVFSQLYNLYARMLLNYGSCLTSDKELVKDCVQDVFVHMLDRQNSRYVNRMSSYLIISLRNRLLDEFRRNAHNTETPAENYSNLRTEVSVEQTYLSKEINNLNISRVNALLEQLTPRQRRAIQLYYIEQRKYEEICELMNLNYHSVRNLVHRGMLKLRMLAC
ncbi:MAG: sigma-70 family RNA polymerase sigma factor [Prevotella sp.]|nr:sigma-70 family RNA polymerase sigma factor [Prevotella sp.]